MVASPRWIVASLLVFVCAGIVESPAMAQGKAKIRYALGDVISIDELPLLIAAERSKARGVEVEITAFKSEEVATQAVINGQADIGQGTPYAAVQKATVPLRFFYQLSTLQFFPVVAKDSYKSWKDLDGQEIALQGRGSGTEAIMLLMAKEHGQATPSGAVLNEVSDLGVTYSRAGTGMPPSAIAMMKAAAAPSAPIQRK